MGSKYVKGDNPFQDVLVISFEYGTEFSKKELKEEIEELYYYILENVLDNPDDSVYLDFDIEMIDDNIRINGNNAISALWLSGLLINDADMVLGKNIFIIGNKRYQYNKKTKKLTHTIINE